MGVGEDEEPFGCTNIRESCHLVKAKITDFLSPEEKWKNYCIPGKGKAAA